MMPDRLLGILRNLHERKIVLYLDPNRLQVRGNLGHKGSDDDELRRIELGDVDGTGLCLDVHLAKGGHRFAKPENP